MGEKEDFRTLIDKMVELIQQKGSATIQEVAQTLVLEETRVEKLALLLEESGLISIRYSFLFPNRTVLIAKDTKKDKYKLFLSNQSKSQQALEDLGSNLSGSEKTFLICEAPVLDKLKEAEDLVNTLDERIKTSSKDEVAYMVKEVERLEKITSDFDNDIVQLQGRVRRFREKIKNAKRKFSAIGKKSIFQRILDSLTFFKK